MGINGDGMELEIHLFGERVPCLCELLHCPAKSVALSTAGKLWVTLVWRDWDVPSSCACYILHRRVCWIDYLGIHLWRIHDEVSYFLITEFVSHHASWLALLDHSSTESVRTVSFFHASLLGTMAGLPRQILTRSLDWCTASNRASIHLRGCE